MVEEEKLAHDVYVTLGEAWDIQTFENISALRDQPDSPTGSGRCSRLRDRRSDRREGRR